MYVEVPILGTESLHLEMFDTSKYNAEPVVLFNHVVKNNSLRDRIRGNRLLHFRFRHILASMLHKFLKLGSNKGIQNHITVGDSKSK